MPTRFGPSPQARAFLADPANRDARDYDALALPDWRAEARAMAEAEADRRAATHGVTLDWQAVGGVRSLVITPGGGGEGQLLYLFGGAFIMGGPLEDLMISAALAAGTGMQVISPAYRLAPEHPFPAGLKDALAVARAIRPGAVAGESAGGNLALGVTRDLVASGHAPRALALLSPAADMSPGFDPRNAPDDPTLNIAMIDTIPGIYAPGTDPYEPRLSPLYGSVAPDWPATLITTGTRDRFLPVCCQLARALREGGVRTDLRVWDGLWHVFEYYEAIPEAAASLSEIASFLKPRTEPRI